MKRTIATLLLLAWVAGCESNTGSDAPRVEGLALLLSPVDHAGPECRIRQTTRVDQARLPL